MNTHLKRETIESKYEMKRPKQNTSVGMNPPLLVFSLIYFLLNHSMIHLDRVHTISLPPGKTTVRIIRLDKVVCYNIIVQLNLGLKLNHKKNGLHTATTHQPQTFWALLGMDYFTHKYKIIQGYAGTVTIQLQPFVQYDF